MTFAFTDAGLSTQTEAEIRAEILATLRATFGNNLNAQTETIVGQLINIFAEFRAKDQQAALAVWRQQNPDTATGVGLDNVASITGTVRDGAKASTVDGQAEFNQAGTISNGDLFENLDNSTTWQVINGPYSDTGGPYPESVDVQLQAVETGPTLAQAGTNWAKVTANAAVTAFTNALDDADVGSDAESAPDLRAKRKVELFSQGQGPRAAIKAAVSKISRVTSVQVYHNPSTQPVDVNGVPFKAFWVVVETNPSPPPVDLQQEIFDRILSVTGAGGEAYGDTYNGTAVDIEGQTQPVGFDIIDQVPIYINIALSTAGTEQKISDNLVEVVEAAALDAAQTYYADIGRNQLAFEYEALVGDLQRAGQISGVTGVTVTLSRTAQGGPFADPVDIRPNERPVFDSPRIVATVS